MGRKQIILDDSDWQTLLSILLGLHIMGKSKLFPNFDKILAEVKSAAGVGVEAECEKQLDKYDCGPHSNKGG